jgi:hypothetical protein
MMASAAAVLGRAGYGQAAGAVANSAAACRIGLVWQPMIAASPDIPALNGHTDTMLDIVGRLGSKIDLAIFTEGNHFPALLGSTILDAFRTRTRSENNAVDNIVVVTLPQRMIVDMLQGEGISFGNLTLEISRVSGFYPDIVMAGTEALKTLHRASIVAGEARVFARNRGFALVVAAGNPRNVRRLDDIAREDIRIVMASASEPGARNQYISALEAMLGEQRVRGVLVRETISFPGRLGIQHRDVPHAIANWDADVGIIFHHLAQYYAAAYPNVCSMVAIPEAERYSSTIAMAQTLNPLRALAARTFSEFFLESAREVYPRYGFATMSPQEFGQAVALG